MRILVSNDDGIFSEGLWALVRELMNVAEVVVSAPEKGYLANSMSVTADSPSLRIKHLQPVLPDVETYCIKGTPADSVILALQKLVKDKIDIVISGINHGPNLAEDIFASGTVGAALVGFISGLPSLSISVDGNNDFYLDAAARFAVLLTQKIGSNELPNKIFLNINLPNLKLEEIKGIKSAILASNAYTDSVEEGKDEIGTYYHIKRYRGNMAKDEGSDLWAVQHGYISVVPLHRFLLPMFDKPSPYIPDSLYSALFKQLQESRSSEKN